MMCLSYLWWIIIGFVSISSYCERDWWRKANFTDQLLLLVNKSSYPKQAVFTSTRCIFAKQRTTWYDLQFRMTAKNNHGCFKSKKQLAKIWKPHLIFYHGGKLLLSRNVSGILVLQQFAAISKKALFFLRNTHISSMLTVEVFFLFLWGAMLFHLAHVTP